MDLSKKLEQMALVGTENKDTMFDDSKNHHGGVSVVWQNLSIIADVKKSRILGKTQHNYRTIIDNANGSVLPGNLVAILGPSGSGKSTIMSVLANRRPEGLIVKGNIEIGQRRIGKFMRQMSGFVFQDDLFPAALTVKEHLNFTAQLKLDRRISSEVRNKLVSDILMELNLQKCENTVIRDVGFDTEKVLLSGGEQKRLSVAAELLTDPALLFCDEPTTGLDSFSAFQLISIMRNMATKKNKTIICSIHQPNPQTFDLFHQIILLHKGRIAFIGKQNDAVSYFERQGELCSIDQNPADFLLKKISVNPIYEIQRSQPSEHSLQYFQEQTQFVNDYKSPCWLTKLLIMIRRVFLQIMRDRSEYPLLLIQNLISALIIGLCIQGSVKLTQPGVQALQAVVFFIGCELFANQLYPVMDHFSKQMVLFRREYANGTNTVSIFLLSNILSMFPGFIFIPILFTVIFYWLAPLRQSTYAFLFSCLISIVIAQTTFAFGMLLPILFKAEEIAVSVSVPIIYILTTLTGVYISLRSIPSVISWICYISWPTYGIEALLDIQLYGVNYIECPSNPLLPCFKNGDDVMNHLGFRPNSAWKNLKYMILLYVIMVVLSYIILRIRVATRRI